MAEMVVPAVDGWVWMLMSGKTKEQSNKFFLINLRRKLAK